MIVMTRGYCLGRIQTGISGSWGILGLHLVLRGFRGGKGVSTYIERVTHTERDV